jgi:cysteine desulfurase
MQRIYMDANATTPVLPEVVEAMQPFWNERFGNASAVHGFGRGARGAIEGARDLVAKLIGGRAPEITFLSGGTESDNLALFGVLKPGDHLIVSAIEHEAVLQAAEALEHRGVALTRVGCDANGVVQPEAVAAAMRVETKVVSVMLANNETGAIQPLKAIADVAHAGNALLHTDAVQACGKIPIDVVELGCDLLSLSAHKMYATQGVGALWVRKGVEIAPMLHGGAHERRKRAGTENVPGIVGIGKAAQMAKTWLAEGGSAQLAVLRDTFEQILRERVGRIAINSEATERVSNTASVRFEGIAAEELVISLDLMGLCVSGGSACQSGAVEASHVLRAMGLDDAAARSSVRFSMTRHTTQDEVRAAAEIVVSAVERLRKFA